MKEVEDGWRLLTREVLGCKEWEAGTLVDGDGRGPGRDMISDRVPRRYGG
jgi:hypothetical protein